MRRGASHSMYQPGNKSGQQGGGGVINNKSMAVSKFMGTGMGEGLVGKSALPNKSMKKIEGHDFGKTNKSTFEQTVSNLKNKPSQKVLEDEYINGLQEEIKYLQYELKLLKDKQILEREGVNELDNFLKDEIPINENILAMKNKYNATKAKLEQQLASLNLKKSEAEEVLQTQKSEIDRLHQIIDAHRNQKGDRTKDFQQKLGQIIKQITLAIDEYASVGEDNRRMYDKIKKMNEELSIIARQNEKQKIAEVRLAEQLMKKKEKFQEKFKANKEEMIETTQQCQELDELEDTNPLLKPMEDQNSTLRKRIMLNQKQRSTAENTIAEIELFLSEEERQREIQRQHKAKYLAVIEECRTQLQYLQREGQNILKDQTLRAKKVLIKEINHQTSQKEDVYNLLTDRLRNLEQECSNLIQDKKQLTDALETQSKLEKELDQQISVTEETIAQSRSTADSLKRVTEEIVSDTTNVQDELQKAKGRLPIVEREIERKTNIIHYLNKQVDLLKELKGLDLQQLHMISQSGAGMQNILNSFIKNWEKIKSQ